ncbi:hypothetical protein JCM10213_007185 [Rhodosporidiobolus nylandii]
MERLAHARNCEDKASDGVHHAADASRATEDDAGAGKEGRLREGGADNASNARPPSTAATAHPPSPRQLFPEILSIIFSHPCLSSSDLAACSSSSRLFRDLAGPLIAQRMRIDVCHASVPDTHVGYIAHVPHHPRYKALASDATKAADVDELVMRERPNLAGLSYESFFNPPEQLWPKDVLPTLSALTSLSIHDNFNDAPVLALLGLTLPSVTHLNLPAFCPAFVDIFPSLTHLTVASTYTLRIDYKPDQPSPRLQRFKLTDSIGGWYGLSHLLSGSAATLEELHLPYWPTSSQPYKRHNLDFAAFRSLRTISFELSTDREALNHATPPLFTLHSPPLNLAILLISQHSYVASNNPVGQLSAAFLSALPSTLEHLVLDASLFQPAAVLDLLPSLPRRLPRLQTVRVRRMVDTWWDAVEAELGKEATEKKRKELEAMREFSVEEEPEKREKVRW